jgi:arylsulfatase A-like enzyme
VFCADHGELLGHDDNDWGHIDSFTPEILHVPLATQNTPELTGPVASLVDVPSLVLGEEHAQGRFDRETAYAADGEGRAITDGTTVLSETDAFDISGEPTTAEKALHRKLSRFKPDIGENGLQSVVDKEDLETLGYA